MFIRALLPDAGRAVSPAQEIAEAAAQVAGYLCANYRRNNVFVQKALHGLQDAIQRHGITTEAEFDPTGVIHRTEAQS